MKDHRENGRWSIAEDIDDAVVKRGKDAVVLIKSALSRVFWWCRKFRKQACDVFGRDKTKKKMKWFLIWVIRESRETWMRRISFYHECRFMISWSAREKRSSSGRRRQELMMLRIKRGNCNWWLINEGWSSLTKKMRIIVRHTRQVDSRKNVVFFISRWWSSLDRPALISIFFYLLSVFLFKPNKRQIPVGFAWRTDSLDRWYKSDHDALERDSRQTNGCLILLLLSTSLLDPKSGKSSHFEETKMRLQHHCKERDRENLSQNKRNHASLWVKEFSLQNLRCTTNTSCSPFFQPISCQKRWEEDTRK
jgi:hypothetical protein